MIQAIDRNHIRLTLIIFDTMELKNTNSPKRKARIKKQNKRAKKNRIAKPITLFELEIIKLIYDEKTSSEIAVLTGKSPRTIEGFRSVIAKKIGCRNSVGIVKYAIKNKIV